MINAIMDAMEADFLSALRGNDSNTAATASSSTQPALTIDKLKEAIALVGKEPLGEWMKEKGCDPTDGWVMFVPCGVLVGQFLPPYVVESKEAVNVLIANTKIAQWKYEPMFDRSDLGTGGTLPLRYQERL